MADLNLMRELAIESQTKILLLVLDGVGGLPMTPGGPTELEAAHTPNLDALAARSICGLSTPVAPSISPGSGPGHLSLFGYDPLRYEIGRGVLEALGIGFDLQPDDVAARGNFCTLDPQTGTITGDLSIRLILSQRRLTCSGSQPAFLSIEPVDPLPPNTRLRLVLPDTVLGITGDPAPNNHLVEFRVALFTR